MAVFKNLTGQKFGRLTVTELSHKEKCGNRYRYYWKCKCECGNTHITRTDSLTSGNVQSCGCLHKESAIKNVTKNHKHKMSHTFIHNEWLGIKQRCNNPKSNSYNRYGRRGIKMCEKWENDFIAFYDYVSKLPNYGKKGYTLDRIDNNKGYEPNNVRWATAKEQCRNRRSNVIVEYKGEKMTLTEAAEKSGISYSCLNARIRRNVPTEHLFDVNQVNTEVSNQIAKG